MDVVETVDMAVVCGCGVCGTHVYGCDCGLWWDLHLWLWMSLGDLLKCIFT